ncbi:MAG TPA: carboxypeptidase M32, partial [Candidatus Poseidoniales archaeon]|nr:carboxypeptidase M32 [Candidatus Poseidoniales archaeon]
MSLEQDFLEHVRNIHRFTAIQGHLGWDQETQMPKKGARARGDILAWLATQSHQLLTDSEFGRMLDELEGQDLAPSLNANVREMRRKYDEAIKLPSEFISEFTKVRSGALVAWQDARSKSDFSLFAPHLKAIIDLTRQKIDYLGFEHTPYDVLLDEYERDMKVSDYDPLFAGLKARLVPLLKAIMDSGVKPLALPGELSFSIEDQISFCRKVSTKMGFDFDGGKMDVSTHPFCAGLWSGDTRFTTRFDEKDPFSCLY